MAELIGKDESLDEGRVKINKAIQHADEAKTTSEQANQKATEALNQSESTQEQLNQVVIDGDSSVEAAQARVDEKGQTHATLKDRIDDGFTKVNTQLAETEQRLDDKKMDKNTTDISINQINKNKGLIDETYLSDELKQQIVGDAPIHSVPADKSITNIKLADDSVGIENINFATKTKNLFNGYTSGYINALESGWELRKSSNGVTAVVEVDNNSIYHVRKFGESDRFRIAGTIDRPVFGSGDDVMVVDHHFINNSSIDYYKCHTDSSINYLVIQVSNSSQKPKLQITKNKDYDYYIPEKKIKSEYIEDLTPADNSVDDKKIVDNSIPVNKLSFTKKTINLFTEYVKGFINTRYSPWILSTSDNDISVVVPVENNSTYHVRKFDESDRLRIAGFVEYPKFGIQMKANTHYGNTNSDSRTIVDTYDNNYLVIQVSNTNQTPRLNITKDIDYQYYIPPYVIDKDYVEISYNDVSKKPRLFGAFNKMYKSEKIEGTEQLDLRNASYDIVYNGYDDLMQLYPDIIERNLLGYGTSSNGNVDTSLPIYEYVITNPHERAFTRPLPNYSPTILLVTGIHGHEKTSVWGTLQFIKQMLEGWYDNDSLASIKNNVTFKVIPVANPGGFNHDVRTNNNGVDLNRNFGYRWEESSSSDKGSAPYSEYESKIIRAWIAENKGPSTIYIDYHNTREEIGTSYISTANESISRAYSSMIKRLSANWDYKYRNKLSDVSYGWVENNQNPMSYNEAYHINDIALSVLLETTWDFDGVRHTDETIEMAVDVLANYLLAVLGIYNDTNVE